MNDMTISDYIIRIDDVLNQQLNQANIPARRIQKAIHYALFPGGKRLRPLLVYLCGDMLNVPLNILDMIAAAIELTHCYSLVHDDLPCMDNDDMRRGKPSCHRAFDEATAILVGDGMQALAIEVLLTRLPRWLTPSQVLTITHVLINASGISGMVSGQSLDLSELHTNHLTESQLIEIHQLKTGQLILACINMVLVAASASEQTKNMLQTFATHLGLVFQMQDDYLDCYHNDLLGKGRASDNANEKTTFATLYSQTALLDLVSSYYEKARLALHASQRPAEKLIQFINTLEQRTNPGDQ